MSETRSKKEMMARIREAKSVSEIVGLFKNRELAEFILNVVEDSRVDYKNLAEYPGFEADYERILNSSLERRPSISGMSKRDAIAEAFMQLVIAGRTKEPISPELESIVKPIVAIARSVQTEGATINDSINATIQIYGRLNDLGIKQSKEQEKRQKELQEQAEAKRRQQEQKNQEEQQKCQGGEQGEGEGQEGNEGQEGKSGQKDSDKKSGSGKDQKGSDRKEEKGEGSDANGDEKEGGEEGGQQTDVDWNGFKAPKIFSHHGKNDWKRTKVAKDEITAKKMKDADDAKARAAEEKKKKEAADAAKAAAKMKEGNVRPGKDREKEEWKQATGTTEKYAEYDYRKRKYVEGGNTVVEKTLDVGEFSGDDLKEIVGKIKRLFTLLRPQDNALLKKQYEGEEIDIESYMQYLIDKRCGMNPEPRYFTQMRKDMRSVATMVLVDMSGSTENSAGNNKKIIEVEKEALYVIAKALEAIGDTFSLCGFDAVEDKDETNFYTFKSFQSTRAKIPNMYAMNENRDGAAIRHATKKLLQTSEKLKLLIVISDGEPLHGGTNYIGTYALEDTKKAIEEARKAGVKPFGIIVGNHEREEFAKMYGNDLLMVRNVTELPELLLRLYKRLTIG